MQSVQQYSVPVALIMLSAAASALVGVLCLASHTPFQRDGIAFDALVQHTAERPREWNAIHILAAGCSCSASIAAYLSRRGPKAGLQETIILLGAAPQLRKNLQDASFKVISMDPEYAVHQFHLHGAPWLIFVDPNGKLQYSGGYTAERNARNGYQDLQIWNSLRAGKSPAVLPAYGCAVGRSLQSRIDPIGLKYGTLGAKN